jgi:Flp pilus assembly protein TadG
MSTSLLRIFTRLARDRSGLSAVEFALIAPLMITTYFGAYEMCDVLLMDRKVTNVAAATTDLVAQATQIANSDIQNIFNAATPIMSPYALANLKIIVSSVTPDANGNPKVAWSDAYNATARAPGSSITLPTGVLIAGASVIVSEVTYTYSTPIGQFVTSGMTVNDQFYERPRRVAVIPRV